MGLDFRKRSGTIANGSRLVVPGQITTGQKVFPNTFSQKSAPPNPKLESLPIATPTNTPTPSVTPTLTPSVTPTYTPTPTPSVTPTSTPTPTPTPTPEQLINPIITENGEYIVVGNEEYLMF